MIALLLGEQGSGKTLFMALKGYECHKKGIKVYTNFKVNYPHTILSFNDIKECKMNNASIFLDEAHLWGLDAREAMSKKNRSIVKQFIVQVRKQGVDLVVATQFIRQIDVRVRDNAEFLLSAKKMVWDPKYKKLFNCIQSKQYDNSVKVVVEILGYNNNTNSEFLLRRFVANDYYHLYDTREVIQEA